MSFESDTERIFKDLVRYPGEYPYVEQGQDFYKIRDPKTGKQFKVSVQEVKSKQVKT